jgi:hypothetical protein
MQPTRDPRAAVVAALAALTALTALAALTALGGCRAPAGTTGAHGATTTGPAVQSSRAEADGLEISFEIRPGVRMDRVPMREAVLRFRNVSTQPVRFYLPRGDAFRAGISTLRFEAGERRFLEPEPQPHGVVIEEADFPLLAPGEQQTFAQPFTLDPIQPGPGTRTARRPGFEDGTPVTVSWTYANTIVRWAGGQLTLDGETEALFEGKDIPFIWTGELTVEARWLVR